jgi:hypothetical protein
VEDENGKPQDGGAGSAPWLEQPPLYRRPLVDRDLRDGYRYLRFTIGKVESPP